MDACRTKATLNMLVIKFLKADANPTLKSSQNSKSIYFLNYAGCAAGIDLNTSFLLLLTNALILLKFKLMLAYMKQYLSFTYTLIRKKLR